MKIYGRMLALLACLVVLASCRQETILVSYSDTAVGQGQPITKNSVAVIDYDGYLPSGAIFDSSKNRDEPFCFVVGTADVISGLNEGVLGMREGGQRNIVIPPEFAYGKSGLGTIIPPNATITYDVHMLSVLPSNLIQLDQNQPPMQGSTDRITAGYGSFVDLEQGSGSEIQPNNLVKFHATCWNSNGDKIASTIRGDSGNADTICAPQSVVLDHDHESLIDALTGMQEHTQRLIVLDNSTTAALQISNSLCETASAEHVIVVVTQIDEPSSAEMIDTTREGTND